MVGFGFIVLEIQDWAWIAKSGNLLISAVGAIKTIFTVPVCHHEILPSTLNLERTNPEMYMNNVPLTKQTWNTVWGSIVHCMIYLKTYSVWQQLHMLSWLQYLHHLKLSYSCIQFEALQ